MKTLQNFEDIYVTADLHLSNNRLNRTIRDRGFTDPQEHTIFVRNLINNTITNKSATLYILGDVGFKNDDASMISFVKSLTPRVKIAFGNHDSQKQLKKLWQAGVFQDCKHEYVFKWRDNIFHLHHLPLLEQECYFQDSFQCFGHTHGTIPPFLRSMDVGLDAVSMRILNLEEVVEMRKEYHNIDEDNNRIKYSLLIG